MTTVKTKEPVTKKTTKVSTTAEKKSAEKKQAATKKTVSKKAEAEKKVSRPKVPVPEKEDAPFKDVEPIAKVDPNTGLIEDVFEGEDNVDPQKQLWDKNPKRTKAIMDLWYQELQKSVDDDKGPAESKKAMAFMRTANSILDYLMGILPTEEAMDVSFALDNALALDLTNQKFDVDILKEEQEALKNIKRKDYETDDDYQRAVEALDDHWWTVAQPKLDMRNPNDAIIEMLAKYGLNE
jgi:hypothetical protein